MIILKIAYRNIFRQKRRSLLTAFTMAGGLLLCSVFIGAADGSYGNVIEIFTRLHTGHVQIHKDDYLDKPSIYKTISGYEKVGAKVAQVKGVVAWAPRLYSPALAFAGKKTTGVKIYGIDPKLELKTTTIDKKVTKGVFVPDKPTNEVVIGFDMATILKTDVGGEIVLIGQGADGSIANDLFKVVGVIGKKGDAMEGMNCYMHLKTAQQFVELGGRVHEIAVILNHYKDSYKATELIQDAVGDKTLVAKPWQVVESQFYKAMSADVEGMWYSLLIVIFLVALGVLNTVLMTLLERRREFGVLKALGTKPFDIFKMILLETIFLSFLASAAGVVLSLLANYYLSIHGIDYPEPINVGGIPFQTMLSAITPRSIYIPVLATIISAFIVCIFPAVKAARVVPVKAMRTH